jgi:hypothetical protein
LSAKNLVESWEIAKGALLADTMVHVLAGRLAVLLADILAA